MLSLFATLPPLLVVDALNPVLFAMMVFAAGSKRPVLNSTSLLLGHTAAYFLGGIAIAFGLEEISERLMNPQRIDFAISGLLGALLVWVFFRIRKGNVEQPDTPDWQITPAKCFRVGAIVNFVGIPFALPYFGAVDQILKADLGTVVSLSALAVYNLAYATIFAVVPASVAIAGSAATPMLERINRFLVAASDRVMPWLILMLGAWLLADATYYFIVAAVP